MGLGDNLMATGMARGAAKRGKRIAFGDGQKLIWDQYSAEIFRHNDNIATPRTEKRPDVEWIAFYKGNRIYNTAAPDRWIWNLDFHATPGEVVFDGRERREGKRYGQDFILIEPNVEVWKSVAPNKDWGFARYQRVATRLKKEGHRVLQFNFGDGRRKTLADIEIGRSHSFRDALAIMSHAKLYIGPEGGLHHGAAALGKPAVVLFGGFIPPSVTGYKTHTNLTGGAEACGRYIPCEHCRQAMAAIGEDEVLASARQHLARSAA